MRVERILYIYILICILMILINIFFIIASKMYPKLIHLYSIYFYHRLIASLNTYEKKGRVGWFTEFKLRHTLNRTFMLMAFSHFLDNLSEEEYKRAMNVFNKEFHNIYEISVKFLKQRPQKVAYFLNVLYKNDICSARMDDGILDVIKMYLYMPSIYCRYYAMLILYGTGEVKHVTEGIHILNKNSAYTHERVLSVGLQNFMGDKNEMLKALLEEFYKFKPWIQEAICNYALTVNGNYKKEMFQILKDDTLRDSVHILCIQYLGKYPYKEAFTYLVDCVKNNDKRKWKYAEYSAKYIYAYPCAETIYALKEAVFSDSWNVRINAADSLEKIGLEYNDLLDVFNGNDRYAMDIMQYFLDVRKLRKCEYAGGMLNDRSL